MAVFKIRNKLDSRRGEDRNAKSVNLGPLRRESGGKSRGPVLFLGP